MIDYKFNEGELLNQLKDYVDSTYNMHYSQNKFQAAEFILDAGHGEGFCIGNILKYAQRYGHKGNPDDYRKDLFKVLHYALIALYNHDRTYDTRTDDDRLVVKNFREDIFDITIESDDINEVMNEN